MGWGVLKMLQFLYLSDLLDSQDGVHWPAIKQSFSARMRVFPNDGYIKAVKEHWFDF